MFRRTVATLLVFGVVFAALAVLGIAYRALGSLFWPLFGVAVFTAVLFFVLDSVSGWLANE
jgi:hypothetical protein